MPRGREILGSILAAASLLFIIFITKYFRCYHESLMGKKISIIFYTWVLKSYFGGHKSDFDENCFKYKTESDCGGFIAQVIAAFVSKPDPGQDSFFSPSPLKLS